MGIRSRGHFEEASGWGWPMPSSTITISTVLYQYEYGPVQVLNEPPSNPFVGQKQGTIPAQNPDEKENRHASE